jgi:aspartate/glutamate racemase
VQQLIYDYLKQGRLDGGAAVRTACADLGAQGCPAVALACTELSLPGSLPQAPLYYRRLRPVAFLPQTVIDPLEILARRAILLCGKKIKEERDAVSFLAWRIAHGQNAGKRHG